MKNINWQVRFNNPVFIGQLILAIFVPVMGYMGIAAEDITSWAVVGSMALEAVSNPYVLGLVVVRVYNALTDPTTDGLKDSAQALQYRKPKREAK